MASRLTIRINRKLLALWFGILTLFAASAFTSRFLATGGFSFLSRSSDLKWLRTANVVLGELPSENPPRPNLFTYATALVKSVINDSFLALETTSFSFHLILVCTACLLTLNLLKNLKAGVFAGVLLAFHPLMVDVLSVSAYSILAGFVCLSLSLFISTMKLKGKNMLYTLAGLSVLTSLSQPIAGLILFFTLFLTEVFKFRGRMHRVPKYTLASLPGLLVGSASSFLYGVNSVLYDIRVEPVSITLMYVAASFGGLLLYNQGKLKELVLLFSWLSASLMVPLFFNIPFLTLIGTFPVLPLSVLVSVLILNLSVDMVRIVEQPVNLTGSTERSTQESERRIVEIDLSKVSYAFLIVLLLSSVTLSSYNVYARVTSTYGLEWRRYGDEELHEVLDWINVNTPKKAVLVAEYPLGDWIEAYTGRRVISNRPVEFRNDARNFQVSYDADSILNAKYEIRNAYLRLRDWGAVAPQRDPWFAVSDGERFINFLYVDENHAQITYVIHGKHYTPSFYNYTTLFNGWIERNSTSAVLCHVFEVEGAVINKTVQLSKDSLEASVEYRIEAKPGATLKDFSLKAWVPWERRLGYTRISGTTVELSLDIGDFQIEFKGPIYSLNFKPDEVWAQQRIEAHFKPVENKVYVRMVVRVLSDVKPIVWGNGGLVAYSMEDLMAKYHIAYAVIPTIVKSRLMDRFGLDFPTFVSTFENEKLTVYKVVVSS